MKKIIIRKGPQGYIADFVGDQEILRLFGTTIILTPFPLSVDPLEVSATIKRLNKDYHVDFE